ncbi:MAG: AAA family ATPase [Saprospiraceae bacterium]
MIQEIHIQNFRCFEDFKVKGFDRINLIGGKNNSGKTCLLEAIACLSKDSSFEKIGQLRGQLIHNLVYNEAKTDSLKINLVSSVRDTEEVMDIDLSSGMINDFVFSGKILDHKIKNHRSTKKLPIHFFSQKTEEPKVDIVKSFDSLDQKLLKDKVLRIVRIVDSRIEDLRTFKSNEGLWIKTINNNYEPLSNYGDAIQNLLRYFTPILEKELLSGDEKQFSILLIDEIENGIHYSAHEEFWENLLKLSQKLNVQIFATTHSREMITAFNNVTLHNGNEGTYFEMARDIDTDEIFAQKHDMSLLQYELETPKSTFRGE